MAMLRTLGAALVIGVSALLIAGCGMKRPSQDPMIDSYRHTGNPLACSNALQTANQNLLYAKQQARRQGVFVNWNDAKEALAAALAAQNHRDYALCVAQANKVNAYVQRNGNYITWKNSLK